MKVFLSICMLSTVLPTSAMAGLLLDPDKDGVHIDDIVKGINSGYLDVNRNGLLEKSEVTDMIRQIQPASLPEQVKLGTISGTVLDDANAPVESAEVYLDGIGIPVKTDASGRFVINSVPLSFNTTVTVSKKDYISVSSQPFNVLNDNPVALENLKLKRITGSVTGTVFKSVYQPLEGASVAYTDGINTFAKVTDSRGRFTLTDIPIGSSGIVTVNGSVYGNKNITLTVTSAVYQLGTIYLTPGPPSVQYGTLPVEVRDSSGAALSGAAVKLTSGGRQFTETTDRLGHADLTRIPVGVYTLEVSLSPYETYTQTQVLVSEGVNSNRLVRLEAFGSITGTIVSNNDRPLADATVQWIGTLYTTTTRSDGTFTLDHLPAGTIALSVSAEGYDPQTLSGISVTAGVYSIGTLKLTPAAPPVHYGSLPVQVMDQDNQPIAEASVTLTGNGIIRSGASTDASGQFSFADVPAGIYTLRAEHAGYRIYENTNVPIAQGTNTEWTVQLHKQAGSVSGSVYGEDSPIVGASVSLDGDNLHFTALTDPSGSYQFSDIPAGSYSLTVTSNVYESRTVPLVEISDGVNRSVPRIDTAWKKGSLEGTLLGFGQEKLIQARVRVESKDGTFSAEVATDSNGFFSFTGVPANLELVLHIDADGYISGQQAQLFVDPGHTKTVEMNLKQGEEVATPEELTYALYELRSPKIVLTDNIRVNGPLTLDYNVALTGIQGQATRLEASSFDMSPDMSLTTSGLELRANVGEDETLLAKAIGSPASSIDIAGLGQFTGVVSRVGNSNLFVSDDPANRTAFVRFKSDFIEALHDPTLSKIYLAEDVLMSDETLPLPDDHEVTLISGSNKTIDTKNYSDPSKVTLIHVILLENMPPAIVSLSAGTVYNNMPDALQVKTDEDGMVVMVKDGYPIESIDDLFYTDGYGEGGYDFYPKLDSSVSLYTSVTADTYASLSTVYLEAGTYRLYTLDQRYNLSGVLRTVTVLPDVTSPVLSGVTSGLVENDLVSALSATSSEDAMIYLVPDGGTYPDAASVVANKATELPASAAGPVLLNISMLGQGDYRMYAIDSAGNLSLPSDKIMIRKSKAKALADIREGLSLANMAWLEYYDFASAGLTSLVKDNVDLYQYGFGFDRDTLMPLNDSDLVAALQNWVTAANDTPAIQRALNNKIRMDSYDWSAVNISTFAGYGVDGIEDSQALTLVEHLLERRFEQGNYKLLTKDIIGEAAQSFHPEPYFSGWYGAEEPLGPSTKQTRLRFRVENEHEDPLQGFLAEDFTVEVNGVLVSLSNLSYFSDFSYDDSSGLYSVVLNGTEDQATYALSGLAVDGVNIQSEGINVTMPDAAIPVTDIHIGLYDEVTRIAKGTSINFGSYTSVEPSNASYKNLVWTMEPTAVATLTEDGFLTANDYGTVTVTATNPYSGISKSLTLTIVDQAGAVAKIANFAASNGATGLTSEDLLNTCIFGVKESALDVYKMAILLHKNEFAAAPETWERMNILQKIISEYTLPAPVTQALMTLQNGDSAPWDALDTAYKLSQVGVYYVEDSNLANVKQVVYDQFIHDGAQPLSRSVLDTLMVKIPSTSIRSYNPDRYASQMEGTELSADGSSVIVRFRVANLYDNGLLGLTASDVQAKIGGIPVLLNDPSYFVHFTELGNGEYSFEVPGSVLDSKLLLEQLAVRVGYTFVPFAANVSVNLQAARIEQAAAARDWSEITGATFTEGGFSLPDGLDQLTLQYNLEQAYIAHGSILTEGSIARIINGMMMTPVQVTGGSDADIYNFTFSQNVTDYPFYSISARNENGYLSKQYAGGGGSLFSVSFSKTDVYPVVVVFAAVGNEKLMLADGTVVPDFEVVIYNPFTA